jgi:signal recognition particle GTPase
MRLGDLVAELDTVFEIAAAPEPLRRSLATLTESEVVIADTPPLRPGGAHHADDELAPLLAVLDPDEVHLVVPADLSATEGRRLLTWNGAASVPTRIIISHGDAAEQSGVAVGIALTLGLPVSFVSLGEDLGSLRLAEPAALGEMVLP